MSGAQVPRVTAITTVRRMSGATQAHLVRATDLKYYVVKFTNNPQHRRILVNELLSSLLMRHLALPTPLVALVSLDAGFIHEHPEIHIQDKHQESPPTVGLHFGSSFPGSPFINVVYDFLPDVILARVINIEAFVGMLVFDKWIGNTDSRQGIYFRSATGPGNQPLGEGQRPFVVEFIDNGNAFDGRAWRFVDSPLRGPYFRPNVYSSLHGWSDLESWIEQIRNLSERAIMSAVDQLPSEWFDKDEIELRRLIEQLLERRVRTSNLIADTIQHCPTSFPQWRK